MRPLLLAAALVMAVAAHPRPASAAPGFGEVVPAADWLETSIGDLKRRVRAADLKAEKAKTAPTYVFKKIATHHGSTVYEATQAKTYDIMDHGKERMLYKGEAMYTCAAPKGDTATVIVVAKASDWAKTKASLDVVGDMFK